MGHPLILQPMRLKFVKIEIFRSGKVVWKNFQNSPLEDKNGTFTVTFKNDKNEEILPPQAKGILFKNNLAQNQIKHICYKVELQKGDEIVAFWHEMVARPELAKELGLQNEYLKVFDGGVARLIIN